MRISLYSHEQRGSPCILTPEWKQRVTSQGHHTQQSWQRLWLIGIVNSITAITAVPNMHSNVHSLRAEAAGVAGVRGLCMELG